MNEQSFFFILLRIWPVLAGVIFVVLFFLKVPYGRFSRRGWGPMFNAKAAWLIMETSSSLGFALWFILGTHSDSITGWVFLMLWQIHYAYRAFVYPFRTRGNHRMPVMIAIFAFVFNGLNSYINGRYLFTFSGGYEAAWLLDPRFLLGALLFLAGYGINRHSDGILLRLRTAGDSGYKIPNGGLFRWVSSPNYLGEIIEWIGWAVLTWSIPGAIFAAWTVANLTPRAWANHRWCHAQFPDYPPERKALIPHLW